jgi:hypothetical protein
MAPPVSRIQQREEDKPVRTKKGKDQGRELGLDALAAYKETHGDCNVPKNYQDYIRHSGTGGSSKRIDA